MFQRKTVLVLGAGTSFEIGFPVGSGLRDRMIGLLNIAFPDGYHQGSGDRDIWRAVERHCYTPDRGQGNTRPYLRAAWIIRDGLPLAISIDNFLEAHADNEAVNFMGKLGIARAILEAEANSPLAVTPNHPQVDIPSLAHTWYGGFIRALTEGVAKTDLPHIFDNLTIITFNYDRSVEQFLAYALSAYYEEQLERMQRLVATARIYHPYGMVGRLPWQTSDRNAVGFGGDGTGLAPIAAQIKTFTESIEGEVPIDLIHSSLLEAGQIVFLGFAYHRQNLQLLKPHNGVKGARLYGTTLGISESDEEIIKHDLGQAFARQGAGGLYPNDNFRGAPMTCTEFMSAYHRTITS